MKTAIILLLALCTLGSIQCSFLRNTPPQTLTVIQCTQQLPFDDQDHSHGFIPLLGSENGSKSAYNTTVFLCHNNFTSLSVTWNVDGITMGSSYSACNSPLELQDVVEIYLGLPQSYMNSYYELQVSPNALGFNANITNVSNSCTGLNYDLLPCYVNGVVYISSGTRKGYEVYADIPFKNLGVTGQVNHLKANIFRVSLDSTGHRDFAAWNPTYQTPHCFHVPSQFGDLYLI